VLIAKKNHEVLNIGDGHVFMKISNNRLTPVYTYLYVIIIGAYTKQKYFAAHPLRWENASYLVFSFTI